jgi:hypothetical protein
LTIQDVMPTFYFDLHEGPSISRDEIGTELSDMQSVRDEAVETLTAMARDFLPADGPAKTLRTLVRNTEGEEVYRTSLTFVEEPERWARPEEQARASLTSDARNE